MLFVLATPIGNLEDVSPRALRVLQEADIIACEDTRRIGILLRHFSIPQKKLVVCNEFSERRQVPFLVQSLLEGKNVVLVSDNGTPTISDPGSLLVREAHRASIAVSPIPGPSAVVAALSVSGLVFGQFCFLGFFPKKKGAQKKLLDAISMTAVFYESPYRIQKTLALLQEYPHFEIALCREMTKKFEQIVVGTPHEVRERVGDKSGRGEYVIVVRPNLPLRGISKK